VSQPDEGELFDGEEPLKRYITLVVSVLALGITASASANKGHTGVTLCHHPGPHQKTLVVGANAVAAHLAHGDYLGPCEGGDGDGNDPGDPGDPGDEGGVSGSGVVVVSVPAVPRYGYRLGGVFADLVFQQVSTDPLWGSYIRPASFLSFLPTLLNART
jgi:hypothetical protein